jgi:hypothetical protein
VSSQEHRKIVRGWSAILSALLFGSLTPRGPCLSGAFILIGIGDSQGATQALII